MNKSLAFGIVVLTAVAASTYGQGTVHFANFSTNKIYRVDIGGPVVNSPAGGWKVQLYWLPGDLSEPTPDMFTADRRVGSAAIIGVPVPGQFFGGTITIPTSTPGGPVWLQLKVWQTAFGNSYEEAFSSPPIGGVRALGTTSNIFRLAATGNPTTIPQGTPAMLYGLYVYPFPIPEPASLALGLLGFGALVLLRRRS